MAPQGQPMTFNPMNPPYQYQPPHPYGPQGQYPPWPQPNYVSQQQQQQPPLPQTTQSHFQAYGHQADSASYAPAAGYWMENRVSNVSYAKTYKKSFEIS